MKYRIVHVTRYDYGEVTEKCYNQACLLPRADAGQRCHEAELQLNPRPVDYAERVDFFGNRVSYFAIDEPHTEMVVRAVSCVEVGRSENVLPSSAATWEEVRDELRCSRDPEVLAARQFVFSSGLVRGAPALECYAAHSFLPGRPLVEALLDLLSRMAADFTFDPGVTDITTPLLEVLGHRRGVCQDFAHLAIGFLRSHGLAARYVSGYLETLPPPGVEKLRGADASHAWVSTFLPGQGWLDLDPTNNLVPRDQHVTLAWGRDYSDVAPLKGVLFGAVRNHRLEVTVDVERV